MDRSWDLNESDVGFLKHRTTSSIYSQILVFLHLKTMVKIPKRTFQSLLKHESILWNMVLQIARNTSSCPGDLIHFFYSSDCMAL